MIFTTSNSLLFNFMHRILPFLIISLFHFTAKGQDCDCKANFLWVKETFEQNDAGFEHIVKKKGAAVYAAHNKNFEERVSTIHDYDDCQLALEDWVKFFRTDHFRFTKTADVLKKQVQANIWKAQFTSTPVDSLSLKKYLLQKRELGIEGIWQNQDLTIAVNSSAEGIVGSILKDTKSWKKGQIIFETDNKLSSGTRFQSTFKPSPIANIKLIDSNLLVVDNLTFRRVFPTQVRRDNDKEYFRLKTSGETYAYLRDDTTVYLRIPSFSFNKKTIDSVVQAIDKTIRETPNLIIDLRDCQGGQDNNFAKLMPYIFTGTSRTVYAEVRSTKKNNEIWDHLINSTDSEEEEKEAYRSIQANLNNHLGEYINIFGQDVYESKKGTILPYPRNIGIIVHENNFSTTEQFILAAKQSRKVKLFGRKTGGALDVSNMVEATSSTGDFVFEYCISRSLRIPEMAVDDMGIHPDFYLDKAITENRWVDFVSDRLKEWL